MTRLEFLIQLAVGEKWIDVALHLREDIARAALDRWRVDYRGQQFQLVRRVATSEVIA